MMVETAEARLKRLRMRSWRRGIKEMDIVLGPFADARLAGMSDAELTGYDLLLEENDQDLLAWMTGVTEIPARHAALLAVIGAFARNRFATPG